MKTRLQLRAMGNHQLRAHILDNRPALECRHRAALELLTRYADDIRRLTFALEDCRKKKAPR